MIDGLALRALKLGIIAYCKLPHMASSVGRYWGVLKDVGNQEMR
jgi:hypothetical protein